MGDQKELFEGLYPEPEPPQSEALRITKTVEGPAGRHQRTFNRLIARIEKLQALFQARCAELDQDLAFFARELHPMNRVAVKLRKELVRMLSPFWAGETKPALGKRQREVLGAILWDFLQVIVLENDGPLEADFQSLMERLEPKDEGGGIDEKWFNEERDGMAKAFADAGLDVDLSDLRPDMNPEEILRRMAEVEKKVKEFAERETASSPDPETPPQPRKKGKLSQAEREQKLAELRGLSIAKIYKQLVRLLHPDLERDEALRHRKEALMKELTVAYKKGDLYRMLKIELEWLQGEGLGAESLGDERLDLYNQILKEQCEAMEEDLHRVAWQPKYAVLRSYLSPQVYQRIDRVAERLKIDALIRSMESALAELRGPDAIKTVRDAIRQRKSR